ncbi:MAG TPA: phosphoribosyltransferase family protein [Anaerolineae bacterium]|nr:phosphoribosyltransferase family protein [Anaerolineae bacterium]
MSYDGRVYPVRIGHLERQLPLFAVAPGVKIAIFNMLGDTAVVETAADLLAARMPAGVEVIVVPEVKAVPLGHALSARTGLPYTVVRKVRKPYMAGDIDAEVVSITTGTPQKLHLDGKDLALVQGKRVLLLDDVVSTGNTLRGMRQLMQRVDATIVGEMAVFTEGKPGDWDSIIALGNLPVFTD